MTVRRIFETFGMALTGLALAACSGAGNQQPVQMPPPKVTVAPVVEKQVVEWEEFTGRTEAVDGLIAQAHLRHRLATSNRPCEWPAPDLERIARPEPSLNAALPHIETRIRDLLARYLEPRWAEDPQSRVEITGATSLTSDLTLDSFQVMEFLMEIEDELDVAIDMNQLADVHTVSDLAAVVARQVR